MSSELDLRAAEALVYDGNRRITRKVQVDGVEYARPAKTHFWSRWKCFGYRGRSGAAVNLSNLLPAKAFGAEVGYLTVVSSNSSKERS